MTVRINKLTTFRAPGLGIIGPRPLPIYGDIEVYEADVSTVIKPTNVNTRSVYEADVSAVIKPTNVNTRSVYEADVSAVIKPTLVPWDPSTDITTAAWLDASDTGSYTLSGSTLSTVTDKSGNFSITVDGTPTQTGTLNSLNTWDFSGSESLITGSGPYASSGNHWAIGVFQWHTTDSTKDSFWSASGTRTYAVSNETIGSWTGEIDYDGSNSISSGIAKNDFISGISSNTWVIVSTVFNKTGNQIFSRLNGTLNTDVDPYSNNMNTTVSDLRLMRNRAGVKLDGRMAEYFHVAAIPGTGGTDISDVEKAEGYLAHKWGLTGSLPIGHPYKNSAP